MVSLKFIPRCSFLSKNDPYAQVQSSGRNGGADCFPRLEQTSTLDLFISLLVWQVGCGRRGNNHSLTTRKLNLLPEEMLKSDGPADLLLTKPDSSAIQNSQTPLPLPGNCISVVILHSLWSGKSL